MTRLLRPILIFLFIGLASTQIRQDVTWAPRLLLEVVDAATGDPVAARLTIDVDGAEHAPPWIGTHGLRYVSVHVSKKQTYPVFYARGTGEVEIPLAPGAKRVRVHVAKGFDWLPFVADAAVDTDPVRLRIELKRWNDQADRGWTAAETHLHYDRPSPDADRDWFHMLAGDDLRLGQFMELEGGMVPGRWARQYAFGQAGEHVSKGLTIVPGEEFRDSLQGHILLFGLSELIPPIRTGTDAHPDNEPPFFDVLRRARASGGLVGPAHGATLGRSTTAERDALLGALDFWEIGNAHMWEIDRWYDMLDLGLPLPPVAGTDLPNNPWRESWQPFFGSIRTVSKTGPFAGSAAWNASIRNGEVYVTSGPALDFSVNGVGPGGVIRLPPGGGEVFIEAVMRSPRPLSRLEVVGMAEVVASSEHVGSEGNIQTLRIRRTVQLDRSVWLAARGLGETIEPMLQQARAHTAAIAVLVGGEPIFQPKTAGRVADRLRSQKLFYRDNGRFSSDENRAAALQSFDEAMDRLAALAR